MKLEDLLNKTVVLELKDGSEVTGILMEIKDIDDKVEEIHETRLIIRINSDEYKIIDINEIENIGEII